MGNSLFNQPTSKSQAVKSSIMLLFKTYNALQRNKIGSIMMQYNFDVVSSKFNKPI